MTKLEVLDDGFSVENNRNPISFIKTRIHMIVEIPVFFAKGKTPMRIELLHSARAIIEADNEMQRIKDKIGIFHEI